MSPQEFKDIRWKQRFENFSKAFQRLDEAAAMNSLSQLEKEGMIQRFEYTFELAWKTLKDYLESRGIIEKFPRDIIKTAFSNELIEAGNCWMKMLDSRNKLSHCYDEKEFEKIILLIQKEFTPAVRQLYEYLQNEFTA